MAFFWPHHFCATSTKHFPEGLFLWFIHSDWPKRVNLSPKSQKLMSTSFSKWIYPFPPQQPFHSIILHKASRTILTGIRPTNYKKLPTNKKNIVELQNRDREVKNHEQAHTAVSGGLTKGLASFSFHPGSDGKLYASEEKSVLTLLLSQVIHRPVFRKLKKSELQP